MDVDSLMTVVTTQVVAWIPKIAAALAVLFFGWLLAGWARSFTRRALERSGVDATLVPFVAGIVYVTAVVLVGITAVSTLGVAASSFVAVVGAAGLAIALAFQGTFSHFASGIMLLTFRPIAVGDWVEVSDQAGTVKEIGMFACTLTTGDNVQVQVPNAQVFGNIIRNYSANDTRRIDLVVGVGYDDDLGVAVRTCQDVITSDPRVLAEPAPMVAVSEMGDSSVNLVVRPWVTTGDYWATRWDLTRALKEQLEAAGCSIPYPQRDVHLIGQEG